jgi:hypothetical protein
LYDAAEARLNAELLQTLSRRHSWKTPYTVLHLPGAFDDYCSPEFFNIELERLVSKLMTTILEPIVMNLHHQNMI